MAAGLVNVGLSPTRCKRRSLGRATGPDFPFGPWLNWFHIREIITQGESMDRAQKSEQIAGLAKTLSETSVVVVTRNHGLTVAQVTDLRNRMRNAGASFKVTKNRLARIALEGTPYQPIGDLLTGPTAFATSADPVAAAKVAVEFAKTTDKFEIVGGAMGGAMGATVLDINGVKALAELPSLDELRAKIIGLINAPATKLAQLANAPAAKLARVFDAYATKDAA
jgi:large subunit ribosomal protein L10